MSSWNIRFTKDVIAKAAAKGRDACAIGYHGKSGGRAEAFMYMTPENTTRVWLFAQYLNHGMTAADALAEAERAISDHRANVAARESAATAEVA